jgi:lambda family phage portal protein
MGIFSRKKKIDHRVSSGDIQFSAESYTSEINYGYNQVQANLSAPSRSTNWNGEKFEGGYGFTEMLEMDYWTLRQRSEELFTKNIYARSILNRLCTSIVNVGIFPEVCPREAIIGVEEHSMDDWSGNVETLFDLWSKDPIQCDSTAQDTFSEIQRKAYLDALICGDVLVVLRYPSKTHNPQIELVKGSLITSPYARKSRSGHEIVDGVELDKSGKHIAYWVKQEDGTHERLPCFGVRSGRKMAWLKYGLTRRIGNVRGEPMLSIILQSLKDLDRYRDAALRQAVVNSLVAMFIERSSDKPKSLPLTDGAYLKTSVRGNSVDSSPLQVNAFGAPGLIAERLNEGETIKQLGSGGTDVNFGVFEETIVAAFGMVYEIPPEVLRLAFSSNYSASQAANNEFRMFTEKEWASFGDSFCSPIYHSWLLNNALASKVKADGLIEAFRNKDRTAIMAWSSVDWLGSVKPATDPLKQGKGSKMYVDEGWSNNARESRLLTGTKFSENMKKLRHENEQKVEALRPLFEFQKEMEVKISGDNGAAPNIAEQAISDILIEALGDQSSPSLDAEDISETLIAALETDFEITPRA